MIRFFLLFIILQSTLFGCALCSVFTPRTHISTNIYSNEDRLTKIDIKWDFAKEFADDTELCYYHSHYGNIVAEWGEKKEINELQSKVVVVEVISGNMNTLLADMTV